MVFTFRTIAPIIFTIIFTIAIFLAGGYSKKLGWTITGNLYLNEQFRYQTLLLIVTSLSLITTYLLNKSHFVNYFSIGQIAAPGQELKWLGIKQGDTWTKTGLSLCFVISSVTAIFMYFQLRQTNIDWALLRNGVLWIILFSLTNSFGEEMIYRLGIVAPLKGLAAPTTVFLISAVLFGIPHLAGMPSGIIGMTLAGILGFVLAKSMYETNGFFWAWAIHFLQDVIIIGTLYLISNKSPLES